MSDEWRKHLDCWCLEQRCLLGAAKCPSKPRNAEGGVEIRRAVHGYAAYRDHTIEHRFREVNDELNGMESARDYAQRVVQRDDARIFRVDILTREVGPWVTVESFYAPEGHVEHVEPEPPLAAVVARVRSKIRPSYGPDSGVLIDVSDLTTLLDAAEASYEEKQ